MPTNDEQMIRTASLKVISDYTKQRYNEAREASVSELHPGDRRTVRSPLDGQKLGSVYRTDPDPKAVITDEAALIAWFTTNYPDRVRKTYKVIGSDREVIEVLFDHGRHLLRQVTEIDPDAMQKLRTDSAKAEQPVGPGGELDVPGIEVETPDGVVACKPAEDALAVVLDLVRRRQLDLDGTVLPVLEGPGGPDAA